MKNSRLRKINLKAYKIFLRTVGTSNDKKSRGLFRLFQVAIYSILIVFLINIFSLKSEGTTFGTWGDFFGGTLNPILTFLTFMGLLITIKLQSDALKTSKDELSATREEIEKSRVAQEEQSRSLKLQNKATELQMFENTFFELLKQHNSNLDQLTRAVIIEYFYYPKVNDKFDHNNPKEKSINRVLKEFKELNQENRAIKNYYMTLYQLIKYTDLKSKERDINAKEYINIVRSLVDDEVLRTLAVNCLAYGFKEYKKYIEEYELFEHIYIDGISYKTESILKILSNFEERAFGKNEGLINLVNKVKN